MNKSETIGALALALSKLQGEVMDAHKDKSAYNYKYADLAGVLEIARPLLAKYELSVSQLCTSSELLGVGVTTMLMHSSGEYICSDFMMPLTAAKGSNAAQIAGSIITYARRYSLAAMIGITQTDDDASSKPEIKEPSSALPELSPLHSNLYNLITAKKMQSSVDKWRKMYHVSSLKDLNRTQVLEVMKELENV